LNTFIQHTRHRRMTFKYTDIYNSDSGGGDSGDSNIINIHIKRSMKTIIIYAECSRRTAIFSTYFVIRNVDMNRIELKTIYIFRLNIRILLTEYYKCSS